MPPIAAPPPAARSMSTRAEALCGTAAAEPQPLRFSTGPLAFELVGGNVHAVRIGGVEIRSEEHTSELQSLMRTSYAVFCLKKKKQEYTNTVSTTRIR